MTLNTVVIYSIVTSTLCKVDLNHSLAVGYVEPANKFIEKRTACAGTVKTKRFMRMNQTVGNTKIANAHGCHAKCVLR